MPINDLNKLAISYKKSQNKAHTQQGFADYEESIGTNVSMSYSTVFADDIDPNPVSSGGLVSVGDTDNIVERIKFEIDIIPDTQIGTNQSQGYRLKLPAGYSGVLSSKFPGGTYIHDGLGKLQIVPSLYGELKGDGSTEYDPILYQTDGTTLITKFDPISWNLNVYSGILFVQSPPAGYDVSASRPGYLEGFLFVGTYLDEKEFGGQPEFNYEVASGGTFNATSGSTIIGVSGSTIINLPVTPREKQEVIISDLLGTAYTTPIMINGNGYNILDDIVAYINTDYGSVTLFFNGAFWSVTGFTP